VGRYSGFLYAEPSFLEGAARVIDLGATMSSYNMSPNGEIADVLALRADRKALAADAAEAMRRLADEIEAEARSTAR
jgi:hypothetical protein